MPRKAGPSTLSPGKETTLVEQERNSSSSVTLFSLNDTANVANDGTTSEPRRSPHKRVKVEYNDDLDIEDTIPDDRSFVAKVSPLIALKNRLASQQAGSSTTNGKGKGKAVIKTEEQLEVVKKEEELDYPLPEVKDEAEACTSALPTPEPATSSKKGRGKTPAKPKTPKSIPTSLATPQPAPENWEEVYNLIKEMRGTIVAPVDTMGCDQAQYKESEPQNRRFATLVSLMLSSQTKDEVTDAAVTKLRAAVGGTLSIENVINADDKVIAEAIGKVGFWRRKTEYIKKAAVQLRDKFNSDVPKTADELCSLPGVGPKMAFLALQVCWDLNLGIGVDVHVHRITNRLGWHKRPTKTPEETRLNLQSWLPKELHREINHMLVGFGQVRCLPVGPKCNECVLYTKGLCPSARVMSPKTMTAGKKRKVVEVEVEGDAELAKGEEVDLDNKSLLRIEGDVKMEDG